MLVRNGQKVWPTCPDCGCRLQIVDDGPKYILWHFLGKVTHVSLTEQKWHTDARGCKCPSLVDFWIFEREQLEFLRSVA